MPLWGYAALAFVGVVVFAGVQTHRLRGAHDTIATMKAVAKAQEEANKLKAQKDAALAKEKDNERNRRYAALDTRYKRLLDSNTNILPAVSPSSPSPERACFARAELERALERFVADTAGIALTGDRAITDLNIGKEWVKALAR